MTNRNNLIPLPGQKIEIGTIIRRISNEKDQQGAFVQWNDGNLILINVIDLNEKELIANEGILRPQDDDELYFYNSTFKTSRLRTKALDILKEWPLYKKNEALQNAMLSFTTMCFVPEQILQWKDEGNLSCLFVPIQQKFRIGRYTERRSPERIYKNKFKELLDTLKPGEHMTYIAMIPQQNSYKPRFFSMGTRPHQITESHLLETEYNFKPSHGGHIKLVIKDNRRILYLDAGSNHIGRGVKTPLHMAKAVADALKLTYKDYNFIPLKGREAFGSEQSY